MDAIRTWSGVTVPFLGDLAILDPALRYPIIHVRRTLIILVQAFHTCRRRCRDVENCGAQPEGLEPPIAVLETAVLPITPRPQKGADYGTVISPGPFPIRTLPSAYVANGKGFEPLRP